MKTFPLLLALTFVAVAPAPAQQSKGPDALSRIFRHNNGTRTETQKMGGRNEIRERVFGKNDILIAERVFTTDDQGRILRGIIYDGRKTPLGSTENKYHAQTGQLLAEILRNNKGEIIRVLYYPGALDDPRYAKRMVAFNLDPSKPKTAPREIAGPVRPIVPVTRDNEDFDVGIPQGTSAPTLHESTLSRGNAIPLRPGPAANPNTTPLPAPAPRRGFLRQKSTP